MFACSHTLPDENAAKAWFRKELSEEYNGLGLYLTDAETLLVTVQDKNGERANDKSNSKDSRICIYVFNLPFHKTVFSQQIRTASDKRE